MSSDQTPDKNKTATHDQTRAGKVAASPAWADGLKQLYDSVVDEPLPDSFKDLLDAFDEGTGPGDDAGTGKSS